MVLAARGDAVFVVVLLLLLLSLLSRRLTEFQESKGQQIRSFESGSTQMALTAIAGGASSRA